MSITGKVKDRGVTIWAVLIGLLLIPINNLWITVIEVRWYALDGTCLPLFVTPIFMLFILVIMNSAFRKLSGLRGLGRGELLTVYMMIMIASTLASHDLIQNLFGSIGHAKWMASDGNKYAKIFFKYLPSHLIVNDDLALKGLYKGDASPWPVIQHWITPLAWWGALVTVLFGMMLCLNIIIRKQWTENEKLVFPLVQLPLAMTAEDSGTKFYKNRLMWAGFGVAVLIGTINGLHVLYPSMPFLQGVKMYNLAPYFSTRPWNAVLSGGAGFQISNYPFAIGLVYFMPLDLSFSCWFFYIARKLWQVFGTAMGWDTNDAGFPYYDAQSSGAWIALGIMVLIGSIPYLRGVWRQAWNCETSPEQKENAKSYQGWLVALTVSTLVLVVVSVMKGGMTGKPLDYRWWGLPLAIGAPAWIADVFRQSRTTKDLPAEQAEGRLYRAAFYGIVLGVVFLLAFTARMGMAAIVALMFFGIYFILSIAITRVRAELGTPHEIVFVNPQQVMLSVFGYNFIGAANMTLLSTMYWFNRGYRSHPMPNQLESFKIAEGTSIKIKPLIVALMLAALVGLLSAYWANLTVTYHEGAQAKCLGFKQWVGAESYDRLVTWSNNKPAPDGIRIMYMIVGAAMVVALKSVRGAFIGWPFHPAGYALAVSYAMDYFWFAFFVSWLIKLIIVRYGGMKLHNTCIPFFLGLVLGDFFIGSVWAIVGPIIGQQAYRIFI